jgi:taurine dioxygenase
MTDGESVCVVPSGGALGAEVSGLHLHRPLPQDVVDQLRTALLEYCVLVFRGQAISEEEQVRFTSYFGRPVEHVRDQPNRPVKEIFVVSNVQQNGKPIGALGNEDIPFHSDLSYLKRPGTISLLYAIEVPQTGGATQWVNCYRAYEALDDETKASLKGLRAVHRHYIEGQNPAEPVDHPIVRTHPETGRKSLYIGPHLTKSIVGLDPLTGQRFLERLFDHVSQADFIWTHHWRVGDLVMWDNRPTLHRRFAFPPDQRRILKRTQIFGDEIPYE